MNRTDDDDNLEDLLRRHAVRGPTPELRRQVMSLRAGRSLFWEAAAASLLVGACLVQIVSSRPPIRQLATPAPDLAGIRQLLREDFDEDEIQLATSTLAGAVGLHPIPDIQTRPVATARTREELQ